jgi:myo-inositol-1(or 4)-monophosphatase
MTVEATAMAVFDAELAAAAQAAISAGEMIRERFGTRVSQRSKVNLRDLVTEVDDRSEEIIAEVLGKRMPGIPLVGEEQAKKRTELLAEAPALWIFDPLDGTTNFTRGLELFTVAVSYCERRRPVAGVVYHPMWEQLYTASEGGIASMNDVPLAVSTTDSIEHFTVSSNMSYENEKRIVILDNLRRFLLRIAGTRLLLSVNLELCLVARGSFDGAVIYDIDPWDVSAGALLVRQAGGRVTDWSGEEWTITSRNCLASNGRQHDELLELMDPHAR